MISFFVTVLILAVAGVDFYLSHLKTERSEVEIDEQSREQWIRKRGKRPAGGLYLKITNTGEKSAFTSNLEINLQEIYSSSGHSFKDDFTLSVSHQGARRSTEIEPHSTIQYTPRLELRSEKPSLLGDCTGFRVLVTISFEDNEGAYEATETVQVDLR
jgi:hypothetical protein